MASIIGDPEVERIIARAASRFLTEEYEFDDLRQIGRVAIWKLAEQKNITSENVEEHYGLLYLRVKRDVQNALNASRAQKRSPGKPLLSLDFELGEDDGFTLLDTIASGGQSPLEILEIAEEKEHHVVRLLVKELGIEEEDIPKKINYYTFVDNGLGPWLWFSFGNSPFRAINDAYPDRFLPHHMARAPQGYWQGRSGRKNAISALMEVLLKTGEDSEFYPKLMTEKFFEEFGLMAALWIVFKGDRFKYLNAAFRGVYHPWEFNVTARGYFDKHEHVEKAVKWLVEEKLGIPLSTMRVVEVWNDRVANQITKETFSEHGLRAIIAKYKSPGPVLRLVYPDKFLPWDFPSKGKWTGESGKNLAGEATRWMIEEYRGVSPTSDKITGAFFRENGLWGMLTAKSLGFNSLPRRALENAYPDKDFSSHDKRKGNRKNKKR